MSEQRLKEGKETGNASRVCVHLQCVQRTPRLFVSQKRLKLFENLNVLHCAGGRRDTSLVIPSWWDKPYIDKELQWLLGYFQDRYIRFPRLPPHNELGDWENRNVSCHGSGSQKSEIKVSAGLAPCQGAGETSVPLLVSGSLRCPWACRWRSPYSFTSVCLSVSVSKGPLLIRTPSLNWTMRQKRKCCSERASSPRFRPKSFQVQGQLLQPPLLLMNF